MGLAVKIEKLKADSLKKYLIGMSSYDFSRVPIGTGKFVYFPVSKKISIPNGTYVSRALKKSEKKVSIKDFFKNEKDSKLLKNSYDIVGSVAIIEVPKAMVKKERQIANYLLSIHPSVKTIVKKSGGHSGSFRIQKYKFLSGLKNFETQYTEFGLKFFFDIRKTYFTPRLASERERIAKLIKPGERVLVMFSGVAPYPLVFSRLSKAKEIIGIEINPNAHKFAIENIKRNKISNVKVFIGDVRKVLPKLGGKFDRIVMPLPKTAKKFLPFAFKFANKGAVIHYYEFSDDVPQGTIKLVNEILKKQKVKGRVLQVVKAGQNAPYFYRVCADIELGK